MGKEDEGKEEEEEEEDREGGGEASRLYDSQLEEYNKIVDRIENNISQDFIFEMREAFVLFDKVRESLKQQFLTPRTAYIKARFSMNSMY